MSKLKWSNLPIPEGHVIALLVGIALHVWRPLVIFQRNWPLRLFGLPVLVAGILLIAWSVAVVNDIQVEKPAALITVGPYAISRNPMYLAWDMVFLALALLINSWWIIFLLPGVLIFTHYFVVLREEEQLEIRFGKQYRQYCARVRRYL
jgi:protein-S-isoprenylcysteine O-methyltransferase Ste14